MARERRHGAVVARYRLDRRLGEGGFAEVWAATHAVTGRWVALKFLKEKFASDERARQRFLREARAASAVSHPNVIAIHDVFEDGGVPIMVMDLLAGESLGDRLERERRLPLAEVATILLPVISAVQAAHDVGVLHRDLKPDNIFLAKPSRIMDGAAEVKVLDFGIAKLLAPEGPAAQSGGLTHSGAVIGTPFYMSPEQFFGDGEIDQRSDVWAIGVIAYECLAGVRPTDAKTVALIVKVIMNESMTALAELRPDLPEEISHVVMRALSFDCANRPTLGEIGRALAPYARFTTPNFKVGGSMTSDRALDREPSAERRAPSNSRPATQSPMTLPEPPPTITMRAPLKVALVTAGMVSLGAGLLVWHAATSAPPAISQNPTASAASVASPPDALPRATALAVESPAPPERARLPMQAAQAPDASVIAPIVGVTSARTGTRSSVTTAAPFPKGPTLTPPFDPGSVR